MFWKKTWQAAWSWPGQIDRDDQYCFQPPIVPEGFWRFWPPAGPWVNRPCHQVAMSKDASKAPKQSLTLPLTTCKMIGKAVRFSKTPVNVSPVQLSCRVGSFMAVKAGHGVCSHLRKQKLVNLLILPQLAQVSKPWPFLYENRAKSWVSGYPWLHPTSENYLTSCLKLSTFPCLFFPLRLAEKQNCSHHMGARLGPKLH